MPKLGAAISANQIVSLDFHTPYFFNGSTRILQAILFNEPQNALPSLNLPLRAVDARLTLRLNMLEQNIYCLNDWVLCQIQHTSLSLATVSQHAGTIYTQIC